MSYTQCPQCGRVKRVPENPHGRKLVCSCGVKFRPADPLTKTVPVIQMSPQEPTPANGVTMVSVLS
jgi:hypothetical protein